MFLEYLLSWPLPWQRSSIPFSLLMSFLSARRNLLKFCSDYGSYVDSKVVSWLLPTPLSISLGEMRKRYEADGYIWVEHLILREDIYDMRGLYFQPPFDPPACSKPSKFLGIIVKLTLSPT